MGGDIRVIHVIDDKPNIQVRWTNPLPDYVKADRFMNFDLEYINEYLNKPSEHRYDGEAVFAPVGYGLDVFDFNKKKIYTNQGYCQYTHIHFTSVLTYIHDRIWPKPDKDTDEYYPNIVKRMFDVGMVTPCIRSYDSASNSVVNEPITGIADFDKLIRKMYELEYPTIGKRQMTTFEVNWDRFGWEVIKFEESLKGWETFRDLMISEYKISDSDTKVWNDYLSDRYEDELGWDDEETD